MTTIVVNEQTKAGKLLLKMARLLLNEKNEVKIIEETDVNENVDQPIESSKTLRRNIDIDTVLEDKDLSGKEKNFYKKFYKAVGEVNAVETGELKGRPLKEVLNEI